MAYLPNQGTNPQGELKSIPIGGTISLRQFIVQVS